MIVEDSNIQLDLDKENLSKSEGSSELENEIKSGEECEPEEHVKETIWHFSITRG